MAQNEREGGQRVEAVETWPQIGVEEDEGRGGILERIRTFTWRCLAEKAKSPQMK